MWHLSLEVLIKMSLAVGSKLALTMDREATKVLCLRNCRQACRQVVMQENQELISEPIIHL
jgi:hypothetical protein